MSQSDLDLTRFEREAKKRIEEHLNPELKRRGRPEPSVSQKGLTVVASVKRPGWVAMREEREYETSTISRLQALIEAERAARADGFKIAHIIEYK